MKTLSYLFILTFFCLNIPSQGQIDGQVSGLTEIVVDSNGLVSFKEMSQSFKDEFNSRMSTTLKQKGESNYKRIIKERELNNLDNILLNQMSISQNSAQIYSEFLDNQNYPLVDALEELMNVDGVIWQRWYGQHEYFLAPTVENVEEFISEITVYDALVGKKRLSQMEMIRVQVTNEVRALVREMHINIPSYISNNVLLWLPQHYLSNFDQAMISYDVVEYKHGDFDDEIIGKGSRQNNIQSTIWSEGFEGSMSPYTITGSPGWADKNCQSYEGSWSLYNNSASSDCSQYPNNMNTSIHKTTGINVSNYTNVVMTFRMKYKTEDSFDGTNRFYSSTGTSWTLGNSYSGTSSGWPSSWGLYTVNLNGFSTYYWRFQFVSDGSVTDVGCFIDDMKITGDPGGLPNLTLNQASTSISYNNTTLSSSLRVVNDGNASTGASFYVDHFISTESNLWDPNGSRLLNWNHVTTNISAGSGVTLPFSSDLALSNPPLNPGTYYYWFYIDSEEQISESNEDDNKWRWTTPIPWVSTELCVTPTSRSVTSGSGSTTFTVQNCGSGTMSWSATDNATWLSLSPASGSLNAGQTTTVTATYTANTGTSQRTGTVTVTASGATGSPKTVTITQEGTGGPQGSLCIYPREQNTSGSVGTTIPLEIRVDGIPSSANFYGVSFHLEWNKPEYIEYDSYSNGAVLGSNPIVLVQPFNNRIEVGATRTSGSSTSGGVVIVCTLKVKSQPPQQENITLTLTNITATQSDGSSLNLETCGTSIINFSSCIEVWPGDANNDGVVNVSDLLRIGLHYNKTGPARNSDSPNNWVAQCVSSGWNPEAAAYADCNGNGLVNAGDVLAIGLNYGRTHGTMAKVSTKEETDSKVWMQVYDKHNLPKTLKSLNVGEEFYLSIQGSSLNKTAGLAFSLEFEGGILELVEGELQVGKIFDEDALIIAHQIIEENKIEIGLSNKNGNKISKEGEIVRVKLKLKTKDNLKVYIKEMIQMNTDGEYMVSVMDTDNLESQLSGNKEIEEYTLSNYPNPFNPMTKIEFSIPEQSRVDMKIYNVLGEEVAELIGGRELEGGKYEVEWDASNLPSGIYIYSLRTNNNTIVKKMLLIK